MSEFRIIINHYINKSALLFIYFFFVPVEAEEMLKKENEGSTFLDLPPVPLDTQYVETHIAIFSNLKDKALTLGLRAA